MQINALSFYLLLKGVPKNSLTYLFYNLSAHFATMFSIWKWLFTGTVPVTKNYPTDTVPVNKNYPTGTFIN